jgi:hypothetical protein
MSSQPGSFDNLATNSIAYADERSPGMAMARQFEALEEAGGGWRVVGLTSDYERITKSITRGVSSGEKLARPPAPRLVRCDELPGFLGYDEAGRW